jgi:hypothetical protein
MNADNLAPLAQEKLPSRDTSHPLLKLKKRLPKKLPPIRPSVPIAEANRDGTIGFGK